MVAMFLLQKHSHHLHVLDLSNAFDSGGHICLFRQLVKLKLPENVLKLLIHWYSNQLMNVRWKHIQYGGFYMNKSSAVAEMGDRGHNSVGLATSHFIYKM